MSVQSIRITRTSAVFATVLVGLAVFAAIAAFSGGLLSLVDRWSRQEEYSHGFLIPLVVGWMLWSRRDALMASIGEPSWSGPLAIAIASIMLIIGDLSAFFLLLHLGFVLALIGIVGLAFTMNRDEISFFDQLPRRINL